jgi:hypothetical protein
MTDRRGRRCTNRASECTLLGILHLPFAVVYSVVQRASLRSRVRSVAYISRIERADERTRTADLLQLRVINQVLHGVAWRCKTPAKRH